MTLHELALKYDTDKLSHGYIPFYEYHLPKNPIKILEIGVKHGSSIRMWREYFPQSEIHGLDLFEEFPIPDIPDVTFHKGNQVDYYLLEQLEREKFDVIIDDGSHLSRHQMMTFFALFNGGQYYIEDTHACKDPFYQNGLPFVATADQVFKRIAVGNMTDQLKDEEDNNYFSDAKLWPNVSHKNIILITNK